MNIKNIIITQDYKRVLPLDENQIQGKKVSKVLQYLEDIENTEQTNQIKQFEQTKPQVITTIERDNQDQQYIIINQQQKKKDALQKVNQQLALEIQEQQAKYLQQYKYEQIRNEFNNNKSLDLFKQRKEKSKESMSNFLLNEEGLSKQQNSSNTGCYYSLEKMNILQSKSTRQRFQFLAETKIQDNNEIKQDQQIQLTRNTINNDIQDNKLNEQEHQINSTIMFASKVSEKDVIDQLDFDDEKDDNNIEIEPAPHKKRKRLQNIGKKEQMLQQQQVETGNVDKNKKEEKIDDEEVLPFYLQFDPNKLPSSNEVNQQNYNQKRLQRNELRNQQDIKIKEDLEFDSMLIEAKKQIQISNDQKKFLLDYINQVSSKQNEQQQQIKKCPASKKSSKNIIKSFEEKKNEESKEDLQVEQQEFDSQSQIKQLENNDEFKCIHSINQTSVVQNKDLIQFKNEKDQSNQLKQDSQLLVPIVKNEYIQNQIQEQSLIQPIQNQNISQSNKNRSQSPNNNNQNQITQLQKYVNDQLQEQQFDDITIEINETSSCEYQNEIPSHQYQQVKVNQTYNNQFKEEKINSQLPKQTQKQMSLSQIIYNELSSRVVNESDNYQSQEYSQTKVKSSEQEENNKLLSFNQEISSKSKQSLISISSDKINQLQSETTNSPTLLAEVENNYDKKEKNVLQSAANQLKDQQDSFLVYNGTQKKEIKKKDNLNILLPKEVQMEDYHLEIQQEEIDEQEQWKNNIETFDQNWMLLQSGEEEKYQQDLNCPILFLQEPSIHISEHAKAIDLFSFFFNDEILNTILNGINDSVIMKTKMICYTKEELLIFISMLIQLGLKKHQSPEDYFIESTPFPIDALKLMKEKRFYFLIQELFQENMMNMSDLETIQQQIQDIFNLRLLQAVTPEHILILSKSKLQAQQSDSSQNQENVILSEYQTNYILSIFDAKNRSMDQLNKEIAKTLKKFAGYNYILFYEDGTLNYATAANISLQYQIHVAGVSDFTKDTSLSANIKAYTSTGQMAFYLYNQKNNYFVINLHYFGYQNKILLSFGVELSSNKKCSAYTTCEQCFHYLQTFSNSFGQLTERYHYSNEYQSFFDLAVEVTIYNSYLIKKMQEYTSFVKENNDNNTNVQSTYKGTRIAIAQNLIKNVKDKQQQDIEDCLRFISKIQVKDDYTQTLDPDQSPSSIKPEISFNEKIDYRLQLLL